MQIIDSFANLQLPETAACIGFFDGVHLGHRFLIGELITEAKRRGMASAIITFRNHPRTRIKSDFTPQLIQSFEEKMEKLAKTGIDYCFVLDFTPELREYSAKEFICRILRAQMNVGLLVIGYDHRFGKNRTDGFEEYCGYGAACGMEVMKEPDYSPNGMHVSSSAIRRALAEGKPELAACLLGEPYRMTGRVVRGSQIGRTIGFPTANIEPSEGHQIIPRQGVYAARVEVDGGCYEAMLNIGSRPTVADAGKQSIEVYLFDFNGDLYGKKMTIHFIAYLRPERKMESLEDLKLQLNKDQIAARNSLQNKISS
ncbi:MAG: bifunctional riboflavin kinase/FAD synthetase [Bacteroidales bacterium]